MGKSSWTIDLAIVAPGANRALVFAAILALVVVAPIVAPVISPWPGSAALADSPISLSPTADSGMGVSPAMSPAGPDDTDSVYAPPPPPSQELGLNEGGVHIDFDATYFNHYVYRGVDYSSVGGTGNSTNLEVNAQVNFDLGKLPHPFVGVFSNVYDSDPVSRFQEIRPYAGLDWNLRPLEITAGENSYLYPNRTKFETSEFYGKFTFDDSVLFHGDQPLLSPYFYGAYDYVRNNGWYFETGIKHDFVFEDTGLTLTAYGDAAYILGYQQQFVFINNKHATGFQHYDLGLDLTYSLNDLLNFSKRYGEFDVKGYLTYSGKLNSAITANNVVWGGVGIGFRY
jgi:hypothetical protein